MNLSGKTDFRLPCIEYIVIAFLFNHDLIDPL